jgi:hypothetical protein
MTKKHHARLTEFRNCSVVATALRRRVETSPRNASTQRGGYNNMRRAWDLFGAWLLELGASKSQ